MSHQVYLAAVMTMVAGIAIGITGDRIAREEAAPVPPSVPSSAIRAENLMLRTKLVVAAEARFEKDNGLVPSFDPCEDAGDGRRCTARSDAGVIVTYRCNVDRCIMECSK